jgi:hypothetical protein
VPSVLPTAPTELVELGVALDADNATRAELALVCATELALAEVPARTAQTWAVAAPAVVRLVVIHAARREYESPRGVYLTERERELVRRAHAPTHPRSARAHAVVTPTRPLP